MNIERSSGCLISIPFQHQTIDALLFHGTDDGRSEGDVPVILRLHGLLGNLLDETEHIIPQVLARHGYSSLTINTLLSNLGLFFGFGIFDQTLPQIEAVCRFLKQQGYKKIILAGHGLGGCMAIRFAALQQDRTRFPELQGVIAIATPYSLPDTIQKRWERFGSQPSYQEVYERAKQVVRPESGKKPVDDETIIIQRAHGPTTKPEDSEVYTLKTWWALAGPEAEGPKSYRYIGEIQVPLLLIHGMRDDLIDQQECEALGRLAREGGNSQVMIHMIDAGHSLGGKHHELGAVILKWLHEEIG